ncbi:MAG TPA: peroxiredoxin, partial [Thermoleophilia bacterium]|nr:peroxiredoxin [Thermoleophilia bacterium]
MALRGTFIIDPEGTLKYAVVHDNNIGRNTDETLRVLQALQTGELCPVDWRPGQSTLG